MKLCKFDLSITFLQCPPNVPALSCGADNFRVAQNELSSRCFFHFCNDLCAPCLTYKPADNCFLEKPAGDAHSVSLSAWLGNATINMLELDFNNLLQLNKLQTSKKDY